MADHEMSLEELLLTDLEMRMLAKIMIIEVNVAAATIMIITTKEAQVNGVALVVGTIPRLLSVVRLMNHAITAAVNNSNNHNCLLTVPKAEKETEGQLMTTKDPEPVVLPMTNRLVTELEAVARTGDVVRNVCLTAKFLVFHLKPQEKICDYLHTRSI